MDNRIIKLTRDEIVRNLSQIKYITESDELKKWTNEQILHPLPKKFEISIAACLKNTLTGYIIASQKESDTFHIHKMMIHPKYRNMKIGHLLMDFFIKHIDKDIKKISLWVYDINPGAIAFYKKFNFIIVQNADRVKENYIIHKMIRFC